MATPITSIKKNELTEEEKQQERLAELQSLIAEQEQALSKILQITGELEEAGVIDAAQAMVNARENLTQIAVDQASREPITNAINHLLNVSSLLTSMDPHITEKLVESVKSGFHEVELYGQNEQKIGMLDLLKSLNDPDVNRAVKFGMHFLKGMGKGLEEKG